MPRKNLNSALVSSNPSKKRKISPISYSKKLRSKVPRRKRIPPFPMLDGSLGMLIPAKETEFTELPTASCSSSCFPSEISYDSSMLSVPSDNSKNRTRSKENETIGLSGIAAAGEESRPITRSYYRQKEKIRTEEKGSSIEASAACSERNPKRMTRSVKGVSVAEQREEISCIEPFPDENSKKKARSCKGVENSLQIKPIAASETSGIEFSDASCLSAAASRKLEKTEPIYVSGSTVDLTCSEELSYGDDSSVYSSSKEMSEMTLSEMEAEIFSKLSDGDNLDISQPSLTSIFGLSSDELSQMSGENSAPSALFSLILQYMQQFSRLPSSPKLESSDRNNDAYSDDFTLLCFEDEEYEESYRMLRVRERRRESRIDYAKEYGETSECGGLVVQQRLLMVNWIVEHALVQDLQKETLFLSVSLLDRFLSRGFFRSMRNLQLLGIACCTLAVRIVENQPLNSIRQASFQVGSSVYSRIEVVAMEWLVQDVLNYQCILPTTYNFLWFYLKAAKADAELENEAKYLAIMSLLDEQSLCFWPSTVAAGLVILASFAANRYSSTQWVMDTHVRSRNDDLPECIQSLEWLLRYALKKDPRASLVSELSSFSHDDVRRQQR